VNGTNGNGNSNGANGVGLIPADIGSTLGTAGVDQMYDRAARYCSCEFERRKSENQPKVAAARAELGHLESDLARARNEVAKLPPEGDLRARRRRAIIEWTLAAMLFLAGYAFAVTGLDPFQLGWKGILYAVGLALIVPYSVDMVLQHWGHEQRFVRSLAIAAASIAIVAMISLSLIRTRLFTEQLVQARQAVTIEGDTPSAETQPINTFYEKTEFLLSLFMVLAALGMEINTGCAVYAGRRLWAELPPNAAQLQGEITKLEQHKVTIVRSMEALEQEPQQFVNEFWRDFHQAMIKGTQRTTFAKMWAFALFGVLLLPLVHANAQEPLNLVVAIDLTASVGGASGLDQKTEFQRNVASVGQLLASTPAGSRVTVIGITDRSFAQPYVLLSARLDGNAGYFKERIASARQQLVAAWQKRSQAFIANFSQTDLLGALVMASQIFEPREGRRNVLVILSDMRHETRSLNLAKFSVVPVQPTLDRAAQASLIGDLKGIQVYVLGVDAAGKSVGYWDSLRDFWLAYFEKAGAKVRAYSMLRDLPQL
jgi:cell division protein FtsB